MRLLDECPLTGNEQHSEALRPVEIERDIERPGFHLRASLHSFIFLSLFISLPSSAPLPHSSRSLAHSLSLSPSLSYRRTSETLSQASLKATVAFTNVGSAISRKLEDVRSVRPETSPPPPSGVEFNEGLMCSSRNPSHTPNILLCTWVDANYKQMRNRRFYRC